MKVRMKMQIYPARRRTYPVRRRISRGRWRSSRGTEIASSRALDLVQSGDRVVRRPKQVRMLRRRNAAAQQSAPVHACGDLAAAPHMQLGEDAVNMILDRCVLDAQLARDLLVGKTLRHQGDDLVLAPRQRAVVWAMASFGADGGYAPKQHTGDARRTSELVAHGAVYRRHQILNRAVAGDES